MNVKQPQGSVRFTVSPPTAITAWMLGEDPTPSYSLTYEGYRPMPLVTGKRGKRRRVDHAREVRMATWKRRRQRRHGIPAARVYIRTFIPRARVEIAS